MLQFIKVMIIHSINKEYLNKSYIINSKNKWMVVIIIKYDFKHKRNLLNAWKKINNILSFVIIKMNSYKNCDNID